MKKLITLLMLLLTVTMQAQLSNWIDVTQSPYNVVVDDGMDDSPGINLAVSHSISAGRVPIIFPTGTINYTGSFPDDIWAIGVDVKIIGSQFPIRSMVISQGTDYCIVAGVIRRYPTPTVSGDQEWKYLYQQSPTNLHQPLHGETVTTSTEYKLKLTSSLASMGIVDLTKWTVAGGCVGADETYTQKGGQFGMSIGVNDSYLFGTTHAASLRLIAWNGTTFGDNSNMAGYEYLGWHTSTNTARFRRRLTDTGIGSVYFRQGLPSTSTPAIEIQPLRPSSGPLYIPVPSPTMTLTEFRIAFYDMAGNQITTPDASCRFTLRDDALAPIQFSFTTNAVENVSNSNIFYTQILRRVDNYGTNRIAIDTQSSSIEVFPNPSRSQCTVSVDDSDVGELLYLYNSNGQVVYSQNITSSNIELDMSTYSSGTYIIKTRDKVCRVIIE